MVEATYSGPDVARAMTAPATQTSGLASSSEVAFDVFVKGISEASDDARLALAQRLKDAGIWTGKISSKFNIKYYTALAKLEEKYQGQVAVDKIVGATTPAARYDVLADLISDGDGDGDGGPKTTKQTYVTSASQTAKLANDIAVEFLERDLSPAEQARIKKIVNAAQRKQPAVQTTGDGFTTTMGGVDEQQLIAEKLQATSEAKNVRATDAYTVLMKEFGGLR